MVLRSQVGKVADTAAFVEVFLWCSREAAVVEAAVDTQAEVLVQHLQVAEAAAGTVQLVESGHYWEAVVVVVESRAAPALGL